ncbi:MAG: hypothetical protein AB7F50_01125 [Fimbriimonadaceae bacterium]
MNKTARTVLAIVAAATSCAAFAQYQKPVGVSARAGVFFPSNGDARDSASTWFTVGAEYKIKDMKLSGAPGMQYGGSISLSLDYYGKGDYSNLPLMLNYTGRFESNFYYTVGAGIGFNRVPKAGGGTSSGEDFVVGVAAGYDFVRGGTPFFAEARYFGSNESTLNGFSLVGGIRF